MALSMTGCGAANADDGDTRCRIELRTVNNRHFKLSLRAPEGFTSLESRIEAVVRRHVRRGTVQVNVDMSGAGAPAARRLDRAQLEAYLDQLEDFCATHDLPIPKSIDGLLGLPGILVDAMPDADAIERTWPLLSRTLDEAVARLDQMRRTEGAALVAGMRGICGEIRAIAARVAGRVPQVVAAYRDRLHERVAKLVAERGVTLAEGDLAREVALLADRSDIAEELLRLESHLSQFDRLLDEESPGRALDFLAQELAREANTIASKSLDVEIAHAVVDIKTGIERLREQVQNLE